MSFVHLHNHTHYSLLDGLSKPKDIVLKAKEYGCPACAITDHGVLYGAIEFYKEAKKHGIKPIIGCEMYITEDRFKKDSSVKKSNHLLLLAKNHQGYQNLMQLVTLSHLEGFYYKPRIDKLILKKFSEGLIATSGCMISEIPSAILSNDIEKAENLMNEYLDIFGEENFYFEVQYHPLLDEQVFLNKEIFKLADKYKVPVVATNDCHYPCAEDRDAHDILVSIQTGTTILDEKRMKYDSNFSFTSPEYMKKVFCDRPDVIENTVKLAEKCDLDLKFNQDLLPSFLVPEGHTSISYLRELCLVGLNKKYGTPDQVVMDRLEYELSVIDKMGFADYFLIVQDFINYAKSKSIVVGPGRGSAAGSLIAYSLGITMVDPLKYGLLFERFLNPDRVSMPDIDIDFADHRRDEIMEYVVNRYGRENVAQVITFGTMTAKAAVRDVGRAMGYPYAEVDKLAKIIPNPVLGKHRPLAESVVNDKSLSAEYQSNPRSKSLLDNAIKLEGTVRHAGTHACAVIISDKPLVTYTPLQFGSGKDDTVITQYSMKPLEEIGLLKMDFLGLKNLTIIEHALRLVKQTKNIDIDIENIPLDDSLTFKLLSSGQTTGVFQLESGGMKRYLKALKPTRLEDIIAMNALYRPGPMEYIPQYIKGKHDNASIKYMHELFKPILEETYGVGVYQEQILEIAKVFAGFSLGQADLLRKAVGKKDPKLLLEQRKKFIEGATSQGHKESFAIKVFDDVIEPFSGYGFNKAHATCYALIAYQTAYLKAHYPTEFMAALLTADEGDTDRIIIEINELSEMGISVLPPSINESDANFTVVSDSVIRFGLNAIKGLGEATVSQIVETKLNGPFTDLTDFLTRMPSTVVNKKSIQALSYSGAFDCLNLRRELVAENYENLNKFVKKHVKNKTNNQVDLFGEEFNSSYNDFELADVPVLSKFEILRKEKEFLGLYVSSHPLMGLEQYIKKKVTPINVLTDKHVGKSVKIGGLLVSAKKILTRSGTYMMNLTLEDLTSQIEVVLFNYTFKKYEQLIRDDKFIVVTGKYDLKRNPQIIAESLAVSSIDAMHENNSELNLVDENELEDNAEDFNSDENDKNIYIIKIPSNLSKNKLALIKKLLSNSNGETKVRLDIIHNNDIVKSIIIKNLINVDQDFIKKINKLII